MNSCSTAGWNTCIVLSGFTLIHAEHQRVNSVNIPLFFSSITSSQSEHSLNLYSTQVTMWPFTGPDTEHADTFLSHRFRRQKDPSRFFVFCFLFLFFSALFLHSILLIMLPVGGEGRKPGSVPFMPFTPGASRRQLKAGLNIYLLRLREEHNKMPARCVCVFLPGRWAPWCRTVSPLSPAQCVHPPWPLVSPAVGQSGLDATGAVYAPQGIQRNLARVGPTVTHRPGSVHTCSRFTLPQREFPPSEQEAGTAVSSTEVFK